MSEIGKVYILVLSFMYPTVYLFSHNDYFKVILFLISIGINIIMLIVYERIKSLTILGAKLKNVFDYKVFGYSSEHLDYDLNINLILKYSDSFINKNETLNWYPDNFDENVPKDKVIAACQRTNMFWAIELRSGFGSIVIWIILIQLLIVVTMFIVYQTSLIVYIYTFYSLQSFYMYFINQIKGHFNVIVKREKVLNKLDTKIFSTNLYNKEDLLSVQNEIFLSRIESVKVPDFYYRIKKKQLNLEANRFIARVNNYWKIQKL